MNTLERIKKGICSLPSDSEQVLDADDEIFLLYTELQTDYQTQAQSSGTTRSITRTTFRGLGHVDSNQDILTVEFRLTNPTRTDASNEVSEATAGSSSSTSKSKKRTSKRGKKERAVSTGSVIELDIRIAQDKTSLRSRKGDTGSVVWKASVDFASMMLQHSHFPSFNSLFDFSELKDAHVLELGSGTGILGVALSPLVRHYTATDLPDLVPLIRKNLVLNFPEWPLNSNVDVDPLDWVELHKAKVHSTGYLRNLNVKKFDPQRPSDPVPDSGPVDVLLVVDCIYNPSLVPPLVETIDYLAEEDRTTVVVVVELRADDVIREFLECWLACGTGSESRWEIWRVGSGEGEEVVMKRPYAIWVGIKHKDDLCVISEGRE